MLLGCGRRRPKRNSYWCFQKSSIIIIFDPDMLKGLNKDDSLLKVKMECTYPTLLAHNRNKTDVTEEQLHARFNRCLVLCNRYRGVHSPVSSKVKNDQL